MENKLTPELKKYKEDFDNLHKKIGELEWKRATIWYGRKVVFASEIEKIDIQLDNCIENMQILIEDIKDYIQKQR
ncbi:MAG: hypothetical protein IJZ36_04930 [Bacilli bacterium]|nr:hypothetical protein [Bacilli bacterium]